MVNVYNVNNVKNVNNVNLVNLILTKMQNLAEKQQYFDLVNCLQIFPEPIWSYSVFLFWSFGVSFAEVLLIAGLQGVGGSNAMSTHRMRTNLDTWLTYQTAIRLCQN